MSDTQAPQPVQVNVTVRHKSNNLLVAIILLLGIGAGLWFWWSQQPKPADTVQHFFTAFNDKDLNGMVECLDPKYEQLYGVMGSFLGDLMGVGLSAKEMGALFPFIYDMALQDPANKDMADPQITVKVLSTKINGDEATVTVSATMKDRRTGKTADSGDGAIHLRKFSGSGWRIVDLQ